MQPGIYTTWAETQSRVTGFSGAMQKKFPTRAAAEQYVREHGGGGEGPRTECWSTHRDFDDVLPDRIQLAAATDADRHAPAAANPPPPPGGDEGHTAAGAA